MDAKQILKMGLPWLRLDVAFDASAFLGEAMNLTDRFVSHRSNGKGWKSLCLHGLGAELTKDARQYGYAAEHEAPHDWTEIAELCPATTQWVKSLPLKRLYRVRFMLVEPGGFIKPHRDTSRSELGPINVALNNPPGCFFKMENNQVIPFEAGSAFLIDISRQHAVVNHSDLARYHLIIHNSPDSTNEDWIRLISRSYEKSVEGTTLSH